MARVARVIAPNIPHHITQRGNRNQKTFFSDDDRRAYLDLIKHHSELNNVKIWAYCLMGNHVHFIVVPEDQGSITRCFQEAHRLYTRRINFREGWRGYLWQGRFASFPMDEKYLYAAVRYVERNPVEAHLVENAWDYQWSSAKAHVYKTKDAILSTSFLEQEIQDWKEFLRNEDKSLANGIRMSVRTGRPLGSEAFIDDLEAKLSRKLRKGKPGPKKRVRALN